MLGYDARVYEIAAGIRIEDLDRIPQIQYEERMAYVHSLTSRRLVHLSYPVWVDYLASHCAGGRIRGAYVPRAPSSSVTRRGAHRAHRPPVASSGLNPPSGR